MIEGNNISIEEIYDCSSVMVKPIHSADGKKITENTSVQFSNNRDWVYEGTQADFNWINAIEGKKMTVDMVKNKSGDIVDSLDDNQRNNFQISSGYSHTNCTIASNRINCARPSSAASAADWMDSGITYHWFRNLSTNDETGYDIQLTEDDGDKARKVFAFVWMWFDDRKTN